MFKALDCVFIELVVKLSESCFYLVPLLVSLSFVSFSLCLAVFPFPSTTEHLIVDLRVAAPSSNHQQSFHLRSPEHQLQA